MDVPTLEALAQIICCKYEGATKKEIKEILIVFGATPQEVELLFRHIHYVRRKYNNSEIIYYNGTWHTLDNDSYYSSLIEMLHIYPDNVTDYGMAMGSKPYWLRDIDHDLFRKIFDKHYGKF